MTAAVPLAHCASRLNLDLWHDEIYTVDYFVSRGPAFIVSDYSAPNNHVLFSLILWPFYCLSDSNFLLRWPSFLFTIGTLAMLFRLAWRLCGLTGGVLTTALLGLNQMFLIHTMQVRGYCLSMYLTVWLASLALREKDGFRWSRFIAIALVGAALLYVMPTNILFFMPLCVLAIAGTVGPGARSATRQLVLEILAWLAAALLALAGYLPILGQVASAARSASPSSWSHLPAIAGNFLRPATHDFVWFAPLAFAGLVAWALPRRPDRPRSYSALLLFGASVLGAFLLTGLLRISPFERNYCPLLVFLALAGGWLLAELTESLAAFFAPLQSSQAAAGLALAAVSLVLWPQLWTYPRRLEARRTTATAADGSGVADGYYCYYAANYHPSAIVDYLLARGLGRSAYRVCLTDVDALNLSHYFARAGLPLSQSTSPGRQRQAAAVFAILPKPPPWGRLAHDCRLDAKPLRTFRLIDDFGYYRLWQSDAGNPPPGSTSTFRPSSVKMIRSETRPMSGQTGAAR